MKTYTVYINKLNLLQSPYVTDATVPLEISETEYNKVNKGHKFYEAWYWNSEIQQFELITSPSLKALREARNIECFSLMNRSPLWFMTLTAEQQKELTEWYQAWLDVTETQEVPKKPDWLR